MIVSARSALHVQENGGVSSTDSDKQSDSSSDQLPRIGEMNSDDGATPVEELVSPVFDEKAQNFFEIITDLSGDSNNETPTEAEVALDGAPVVNSPVRRQPIE